MKLPTFLSRLLLATLPLLVSPAAADRVLQTNSLNVCQQNLGFSAKLFNLIFFPNNNSALVHMDAVSSVEGSVKFDIQVIVYGYPLLHTVINPCDLQLAGLCPMTAGEIPLEFSLPVPPGAGDQVPGIAYIVPDLDAVARIYLNNSDTGEALACVEADISNGKTVDLVGVKWATAIIAGLALLCAAFVSGLGHQNTAAHIAANALALFSYFQAQAIIGLTAVPLPPLVKSWTQDFQWSMGIIHVNFMQVIFRWYQRATGGNAARLLDSLGTVSVSVEKRKRSLDYLGDVAETGISMFKRAASMAPKLLRRANIETESGGYVVFGIQRVAFRAGIETTNLFMTGLTFFIVFVVLTSICVASFKFLLDLAAKRKWIGPDKFLDFRNGWLTVLKGILFRITLIGFPQMTILCLWEFTQNDSPAEVVLAVFFFFAMLATLGWAAWKVFRIARRSIALHRNPAYILFSDPLTLNKWGFLYIQFRASAYYFIIPVLAYMLVKSMIVAFGQQNGTAQAIAFIIVEAGALIAASVLRPWMDKTTNTFNVAICVVNFLNAICLLVFTNVFNAPGLVVGIVGVVLVLLNVIMSLILLIILIVKTTLVFFRKNPDAKYQFMADDRASFMKSSTQLDTTTELDALAATARGEKGGYRGHVDLDDGDSIHSDHSGPPVSASAAAAAANVALPPSTASSAAPSSQHSLSSGAGPLSTNMLPAPGAFGAFQQERPRSPGLTQGYPSSLRGPPGARPASPFGGAAAGPNFSRPHTPGSTRSQANPSPWQRGAGYD